MKAMTTYQKRNYIPYPNAATKKQVVEKILDRVLLSACGMGITAIFLFLLTIG